ncbi:MAG TPA: hypothetical protein VIF11_23765 [Methylomirabilota bacterium]|jgi:hypothetical protein
MTPTVGIFFDRASAERAVNNLRAVGLSPKSIHVLVPGSEPLTARVPTSEAEQPGMGKAIGGVLGGAVGAASGAEVGAAAAASALLPVAGPAIAIGIVGAVLLSLGGAAVGGALENALETGLPRDELFLYEDALRRGYVIVLITPADADEHQRAVAVMEGSGAESVDAARERWWIGLRDSEAFEYRADGHDFQRDEAIYREGFEAAMSSPKRDRAERDTEEELKSQHPATYRETAFRRGYDRGRAYARRLLGDRRPGSHNGV